MNKTRKKLKIIRKECALRTAARRARIGGRPHKSAWLWYDELERKSGPQINREVVRRD
ncbi:hypothetical protein [Paraburkholderia heleia]|uniref:hypothetical protein n=1 Tax=Paraburkholderia heleia TaxID=634127 RepID=UPI002AB662DF|nr:hypothetical protein [Paraburkholderia heleia]